MFVLAYSSRSKFIVTRNRGRKLIEDISFCVEEVLRTSRKSMRLLTLRLLSH